jgi:hypothetical protein
MRRTISLGKLALWGAGAGLVVSVIIDRGYQIGFFPEFLVWVGTIISIPAVALHVNPYVMNAILGAIGFILGACVWRLASHRDEKTTTHSNDTA